MQPYCEETDHWFDEYAEKANARLRRAWSGVLRRRASAITKDGNWSRAQCSDHMQAATIWFQLQRILDENIAIRAARIDAREGQPENAATFEAVFHQASEPHAAAMQDILTAGALRIGPTITAHPTEAKRVSVLEIHRRIYRLLVNLESSRWSPREVTVLEERLEAEIDQLWMTGELRLERPSLEVEIDWGLQFFQSSLLEAVPRLFQTYCTAAQTRFGKDSPDSFALEFHSWIGGDRDGNPNVTTDATRTALKKARQAICAAYLFDLDTIIQRISISEKIVKLPDDMRGRLLHIIENRSTEPAALALRNPNELFRQTCAAIRDAVSRDAYANPTDFVSDLSDIETALDAIDAQLIAKTLVRPVRWKAQVFGFRMQTLDIRQNSDVTTRTIQTLWGGEDKAPEPFSAEWSARLREELVRDQLPSIDNSTLTDEARGLMDLLKLMLDVATGPDPKAIGPFILSMTRSADDLLGVFLLSRYAGFGSELLPLRVVPLFETIEDLQAAPKIMEILLKNPLALRSLKGPSGQIEIMLGYSDSNKDGGFVASVWALDRAQRAIARALIPFHLKPVFFHGRGGSVSRGGTPTERAIASQPVGTLNGAMRLTEQGEVVSAKYANVGTAAVQLETLAASVLRHSAHRAPQLVDSEAEEAMQALSSLSQMAYAKLVHHPGFVTYFTQSSPVNELALLKIGSRPARRFGEATLDDLRAIPWVFAWSQNRHMITGWYGLGSALAQYGQTFGADGKTQLARMFSDIPLFRLIIDEAEKSLYLANPDIAKGYSDLVQDAELRGVIWNMVRAEYDVLKTQLNEICGQPLAMRFPSFCERHTRNHASLSQAHRLQIELLREARQGSQPSLGAHVPLMQSMNTISAGLGWTG